MLTHFEQRVKSMCISGQVQEGLHTLSHLLIVYTIKSKIKEILRYVLL